MALELGALNLAIRDTGGAEVVSRLKVIDGQGAKLGAKGVRVPVTAPGATAAAAGIRTVGTAATTSTAQVGRLGAMLKTLSGAGLGFGILGAATAIPTLLGALGDTARAYDDVERAQRKLVASSKLTGAALEDIQKIAKDGETTFRLSAGASADFTASVVKLTSRAGELNKSGEFMARWLDLAAANGLSATEAMQALETTIIGQDEGLNRLGLSNPQQIYEAWGKAAGVSAAKMNDAQKAQAIINEIVTKGTRVTGEYVRAQDTAAGKSQELARQTEMLKAKIGELTVPLRMLVVGVGTTLAGAMGTVATKVGEAIAKLQDFRAQIGMLATAPVVGPAFALLRGLLGDKAATPGKAPAVTFTTPMKDAPVPPTPKAAPGKGTGASAADVERTRQNALEADVRALTQIADLRTLEGAELGRAVELERILRAELEQGNTTLERRADLLRQLNDLSSITPSIEAAKIRDITGSIDAAPATSLEVPVELRPVFSVPEDTGADVGLDIGYTIGSALAIGIEQAFAQGSAAEGLKAVGAAVLSAFGDMFIQIGTTALMGSKMLAAILKGLYSLNPFAMAAASVALIAIGAAIKGAARSAVSSHSAMGGGGGSLGGGASLDGSMTISDPMIRRATLPVGARPGTGRAAAMPGPGPAIHVIGIHTAQGERLIGTANRNFDRRGGF